MEGRANPITSLLADDHDVWPCVRAAGERWELECAATRRSLTVTALIQNSQNSGDADDVDAAGAPTVYKSHSGSIVETFKDPKAKAESQLADARQTDTAASHNFQML